MNIVFCRPGWSFSSKWVTCWTDMMFYCAQKRIGVIDRPASFHNIHMVRDMCLDVNIAKEGQKPFDGNLDYTHMMWIDSDQVWNVEHFQKLLDDDEDIVSGWYSLSGTSGHGICAGWYDEKTLLEKNGMPCVTRDELKAAPRNEKGLVDLTVVHPEYDHPWVGMGFMLVKKGVFESLEYPWFYEDCLRVGNLIGNRGDDITFCRKAHDKGYKIFIDPDVRVGHEKLVVV